MWIKTIIYHRCGLAFGPEGFNLFAVTADSHIYTQNFPGTICPVLLLHDGNRTNACRR